MAISAFLITPFSPARAGNENAAIFAAVQTAIRDAATRTGIELIHPAEVAKAGEIMQQIRRDIARADFVLALLTGATRT